MARTDEDMARAADAGPEEQLLRSAGRVEGLAIAADILATEADAFLESVRPPVVGSAEGLMAYAKTVATRAVEAFAVIGGKMELELEKERRLANTTAGRRPSPRPN